MIGPQSLTFQALLKRRRLKNHILNFQNYITLVTHKRTYDFQFDDKEEVIRFYIAMSECIWRLKPNFLRIVNYKFLQFNFMRLKLEFFAEI